MKTSTLVLAGVAVFAGVFGALQADRFVKSHAAPAPIVAFREASSGTPVVYAGAEAGAAPFDFRAAAKKVNPSVVSVDQYQNLPVNQFGFGGGGRTVEREVGQGSGVVLSEEGIIVTNNHVVADATRVVVHLSDGRTVDAKVLGKDARSDLAVLKIEAKNLTPIETAADASVEVGQWVLAVGNPLGFSNTVSVGVVSSLKRDLPVGVEGMTNAIQTDAAINPGNSGGALCDAQGRLIGINSAIASGTGQSVGIGFSIPVDRVKEVVQAIVKDGYVRYAGLGVGIEPHENLLAYPQARQQVAEQSGSENVPSKGLLVMEAPGVAGKAGIGAWDVLLSIGGQKVNSKFDLNKVLMAKKPGDTVAVEYWTKGQTKTVQVALQEMGRPERKL